jgi:hypothetical protein
MKGVKSTKPVFNGSIVARIEGTSDFSGLRFSDLPHSISNSRSGSVEVSQSKVVVYIRHRRTSSLRNTPSFES